VLHSFQDGDDGGTVYSGLIVGSVGELYGTTSGLGNYGSNGHGTVFAIKTNGTGYTNLYSFTALDPTYYTNSDGTSPRAGLVLSGNTLYGTAIYGGSSGKGTVFAVNLVAPVFNFQRFGTSGSQRQRWQCPRGGLVLSGNTLWDDSFGSGDNGRSVQDQHRWHGLYDPSQFLTNKLQRRHWCFYQR
jgi:uncharacterized repeat protein (TIGR03803 family)